MLCCRTGVVVATTMSNTERVIRMNGVLGDWPGKFSCTDLTVPVSDRAVMDWERGLAAILVRHKSFLQLLRSLLAVVCCSIATRPIQGFVSVRTMQLQRAGPSTRLTSRTGSSCSCPLRRVVCAASVSVQQQQNTNCYSSHCDTLSSLQPGSCSAYGSCSTSCLFPGCSSSNSSPAKQSQQHLQVRLSRHQ